MDTGSVDTGSVDTDSVDTDSVDTDSMDTDSMDTASVDTDSMDTASVDTDSMDTDSVETSSFARDPADSGSIADGFAITDVSGSPDLTFVVEGAEMELERRLTRRSRVVSGVFRRPSSHVVIDCQPFRSLATLDTGNSWIHSPSSAA